jgi:pyruvate dehydrogenase (quinone)
MARISTRSWPRLRAAKSATLPALAPCVRPLGAMARIVAEQIVQLMSDARIERIYGVVGDALNPLTDAIHRSGKLRWIPVRHEEVAAFAAGADAQMTGRPAACAGTCGPGNLHLINGLYDAQRNGASVFAIAGQVPTKFIGTDYFQETHPELVFRECTRYCQVASTPAQAATMSRLALQAAIVEKGVGMVAVSGDVLDQKAEIELPEQPFFPDTPRVRPCEADLDAMAALIEAAERPLIFGGEGCRHARDEVLAFAEALQAPVGFTFRGKDILEADNPNAVGMTGLLGWGGLQHGLNACDLFLMLGTDFPYSDFLPKRAKVIQVDSRAEHLGRRTPLTLGLCGHVRETLDALLPRLRRREDRSFLDEVLEAHEVAAKSMQAYVGRGGNPGAVRPERVADAVNRLADPNAIFTADTGMSCVWAARYLTFRRDQRFLASFGHGTMANAMPQAIGAQLACPDRQVIALCGDGGLTMLLGDLLTVVAQKLPIKLVLFDNSSLGMVRAEMMVAGYPFFGTEVQNPNFAAVASAMGIHGERVDRAEDVPGALERAMAYPGPALVDVTTDPNALAMPPKKTFGEVKGFALAMTRMVFEGEGDKAVEMVKENVRTIV